MPADEVEDTKILNDEIKKLREENASLAETLKKMEIMAESRGGRSGLDEEELIKVLGAIEITVPGAVHPSGKDVTRTLFSID